MRFDELNEDNYILFAIKYYENPQSVTMEDFESDLKRIRYVKRLLKITKESLYVGIKEYKEGNRVGDVAFAIQNYCEKNGYGVVRDLCGHGLGTKMHEEPEMPNFGKRGKGKMFVEGMTVAIEPMINMGTKNVKHLKDGWTILTADGKPSAHFEHNVALINGKPEILSTFDYVYEALGIKSDEEKPYKNYV